MIEDWKDEWMAINRDVDIDSYVYGIRTITVENLHFLLIGCRDAELGDDVTPLGSFSGVNIFSRKSVRVPYHITLRTVDQPTTEDGRHFSDWHWSMRPRDLEDAIEFAASTGFLVTLSTVKSGASLPLNIHFQGVPRTVKWEGVDYKLFTSLLNSQSNEAGFGVQNINIAVQNYPALVIKISGNKVGVCEKVLRLSLAFDHLKSFNLVIDGLKTESSHTEDDVAIYFFPRRFDGQVVPSRYKKVPWAFGAFEMAGTFLIRDEDIYRTATGADLVDAVREVSIPRNSIEGRIIENLLIYS